ncbi:MAG: PEP-CTERM sorting domain-containing protein [Erythrobacter sp.]
MAEVAPLRLGRIHRHFTILLFGAGAVLLGVASLAENDSRGLLRWDRPAAFAAGEARALPNSYDIVYLGLGQPHERAGWDGRRAARFIPLREGLGIPGTPTGTAAQPGYIAPRLPDSGAGQTKPTGTPVAGAGNPSVPRGPTAFTPSTFGGGGGNPPGVIVTDNPPVPAVPEPAAWLLMILGVGVLAAALRHRAMPSEADGRKTSARVLAGQLS